MKADLSRLSSALWLAHKTMTHRFPMLEQQTNVSQGSSTPLAAAHISLFNAECRERGRIVMRHLHASIYVAKLTPNHGSYARKEDASE